MLSFKIWLLKGHFNIDRNEADVELASKVLTGMPTVSIGKVIHRLFFNHSDMYHCNVINQNVNLF